MCRRGRFSGSIITDGAGLLLADHNCPVEPEVVAACGSVLGEAMKQAGELLRQTGANNISLDINYVDKVSLHRFEVGGLPCFLMVICPQQVDERSEIEVSIEQIRAILLERASGQTSPPHSALS